MINVTLEELRYAVLHDDRFNGDMFAHDIDHVLEIALMKMGFTSMQSPIRIDLGNGEALIVSLEGKLLQPMKFIIQELRPEVLAFALLMEARLREKDADRGGNSWKGADVVNLLDRTDVKQASLDAALMIRGDQVEATKHSVDLANYAMMIVDVVGALEAPAIERKADEPLEIPAFLRTHKD